MCCQLDILSRLRTPGAVRAALASLPSTLDKAYEELLSRIDGEDRKLAREILELLAFSLSPMQLAQVLEFLQITPGVRSRDDSKCLTNPKDILGICGSLLNLQGGENGYITLAHHSVKTYLTSDPKGKASYFKLNALDSHRNIAMKCLAYLSFDDFADGPYSTSLIRDRYRKFPLLAYAARRWANHTRRLQELDDSFWAVLKPFLFSADENRGNFLVWVQILIPQSKNVLKTSPLYYASSFGLSSIVRYLLEGGADSETHGGRCGATPINIASFRGYIDVVKILLDYGADPLATDESPGWNAIQWARYNNHRDVTELFAQYGYKVNFDRNSARQELNRRRSSNVESSPWMESLSVISIRYQPAWRKDEHQQRFFWQLLCLAESCSKHPAGIAIFRACKQKLQITTKKAVLSFGSLIEIVASEYDGISTIVELTISGSKIRYGVRIGTMDFLAFMGVAPPETPNSSPENHDLDLHPTSQQEIPSVSSSPIKSHMHVAIDGVYAGLFLLSDAPPPASLRDDEESEIDSD